MRKKCVQLHIEIQKNQQMLYEHMQSIQKKEENAVEVKLHNLETILSEQYKVQQIQFANLDDFDFHTNQNPQFYNSKKTKPLIKQSIKKKKITKTTNLKNISATQDEEEEDYSDTVSEKNQVPIIEEEEEEETEESTSNTNLSRQSITVTKKTTIQNS